MAGRICGGGGGWRVGIDRSEVYGINRGGRGSEVGDVLLEGVAAARR